MTLLIDSLRDVRHGLRVLARAPGFTAAALATLALGVGATAAIFSIVRTVMLAPLPYREPGRIVAIWETNRGGTARNVIAPSNFVAWRERSRTLEHLGMIGPAGLAMMVDNAPDRFSGHQLSAEVFRAIGVQPAMGRAFSDDEDTGGKGGVIVLSHECWQARFGGRTDVLGLTISTNDGPKTVVGVMPPGFTVTGQKTDFLIPYAQTLEQLRASRGRGSSYTVARLRDGVTFEQATAEMRSIYSELEREAPPLNARRTVMVLRLHDQMVEDVRPALFTLMAAVGFVLLVACVNVANLLLARCAARTREVSVRAALGARRGRLVRQMLTESLVLAAAGGVAGLGVAAACHRGLLALVGDRIPVPRLEQIALDLPVVLFTMAVAVVTGVIFGVVPAFASTSGAIDALREGGRHGGGRRLHRVLRTLVVAEVALSLVLIAAAGLLMRSFMKLQGVDPGFRSEGVLTATVQLPSPRYDTARAERLLSEVRTRLSTLPGVQHVAGATCQPVPFACIGTSYWRTDLAKPAEGQVSSAQVRPVTPGFFETLGIPQSAGRDFNDGDTVDSTPVAIVSEELVRRQFPEGNPLGRRLRVNVNHANGRDDVEWTIVGVVGDTRSTLDGPIRQTIFLPRPQRPATGVTFFLRSESDPLRLSNAVTQMVRGVEPEAPIGIRALDDVLGATIARPRATSVIVGAFALVALGLAAVGVYGVMAYSVRERTQEIGVRMALGASSSSVFRLVLGDALRLVAIGVVVGFAVAAAVTRLLSQLLFGVGPLDPWTFGLTAFMLLAVAVLASYLPARRGMRMAPVEALRVN